ncbi:hypothetical protein BDF20DRAFT_901110 [Mycotypha africana]|uniref:uncharacterized protein n=1 Tax=Mycotypha africana TaxID=64632 RepID=UPI002301D6C4|nr:uncharacterized protein BDF20DRAFT_901110 [Mycotypha africana]KAI8967445.1 hypothetical protein BDF20DRAFT_901110 [Mycotypha africana]
MHLGLLSQERLSFDPIKPLILRGPPSENASSVFTGNVVLSLAKTTKVNSITVTFKSTATTYWPEGIGARGTRLTHEKVLSEETVQILKTNKDEYIKLPSGVHRFPFAFIVPNSIVETIEDVYGRVRHTVDARVIGPGIQLLNNWHISKPVLVLRAYMSDSLLTNNSLQDLSRTYEKHLPAADIQLVVERAAFSSGDLFHLKLIVQPQRKRVRLDHVELTVTENRRYHVSEVRANRTDSEQFTLPYLASVKLAEGGEIAIPGTEGDLRSVFSKHGRGVDLTDTIAYRITFATPTCMRNIHHTTYFKDILFKHHLNITLTISFVDNQLTAEAQRPQSQPPSANSSSSSLNEDMANVQRTVALPVSMGATQENHPMGSADMDQGATDALQAMLPPPPPAAYTAFSSHLHHRQPASAPVSNPSTPPATSSVHPYNLSSSSLNTSDHHPTNNAHPSINNNHSGAHSHQQQHQSQHQAHAQSTWLSKLRKPVNAKENGTHVIRKRETIRLETPITVFDCRLKEDYGRLPSYSELNVTTNPSHNDDKNKMMADLMEQDLLQVISEPTAHAAADIHPQHKEFTSVAELQPQLCPCYFKFRRQMDMAAQAQLLQAASNENSSLQLERIPSIPPPDYVETTST